MEGPGFPGPILSVHLLAGLGVQRLRVLDAVVLLHLPDVVGEDDRAGELGRDDVAVLDRERPDLGAIPGALRRGDVVVKHPLDDALELVRTLGRPRPGRVDVVEGPAERAALVDRALLDGVRGRRRRLDGLLDLGLGLDLALLGLGHVSLRLLARGVRRQARETFVSPVLEYDDRRTLYNEKCITIFLCWPGF